MDITALILKTGEIKCAETECKFSGVCCSSSVVKEPSFTPNISFTSHSSVKHKQLGVKCLTKNQIASKEGLPARRHQKRHFHLFLEDGSVVYKEKGKF